MVLLGFSEQPKGDQASDSDRYPQAQQVPFLGSSPGVWNRCDFWSGERNLSGEVSKSVPTRQIYFLTFSKGIWAPKNNRNVALAFSQRRLSEQDKISVQIYGKLPVLGVKIWFGEFREGSRRETTLLLWGDWPQRGRAAGGGRREQGRAPRPVAERSPCTAPE